MQAKLITTAGSLAVALALSIGTAFADSGAKDAPIQVAALSTSGIVAAEPAFPAHEAGVRAAAQSGPEALRRYVLRTRMIHYFSYNDFARLLPAAA